MAPGCVLLACLVIFSGVSRALEDPCVAGKYKEINDNRRSTAYRLDPSERALCDSDLPSGWYRFTGSAGGMMPEKCVHRFQCGTLAPMWMNGTHPSVSEGMVPRVACAQFGGEVRGTPCCDHHVEIGVKNCGSYFVYFLNPPQSCSVAYCAGNQEPCPSGQWSATGFAPCINVHPHLVLDPTFSPPEVHGHAFRFTCTVNHQEQNPDLMFEAQWIFDGSADSNIPNVFLQNSERRAFLPGTALRGHVGHTAGCRVRAWYANRPTVLKSDWRISNESYLVTVKVEPGKVEVSEKGGNANVTVISTIPLVCDNAYDTSCCLYLLVDVDGPKNNARIEEHPCRYQLCSADWDPIRHRAVTTITLAATPDGIRDGDKEMLLAFNTLQPAGLGPYLEVFNNYTLPSVPIVAKDVQTEICKWSGDPHIVAFNGNYFDLYEAGDFTAYVNDKSHFEVQIRTILCNKHASCQCGIAIRELNDVIRIDNCQHIGHAPVVETNHQPLREGTVIQRSNDGMHVMVYLPSGREIRVDASSNSHSVQFVVPASDSGQGQGLCGTPGGKKGEEYTHRNGSIQKDACLNRGKKCTPSEFEESWRNDHRTSLFENVPDYLDNLKDDSPHYCQCDKGGTDSERINCSVAAHIHHATRCGSNPCPDVTANLPSFMRAAWAESRREQLYLDVDERDPPVNLVRNAGSDWIPSWPTESGITEAQAREKCTSELQKAQLFHHCRAMNSVYDNNVESCVTDVQFSDNFNMVDESVAAFTGACQFEMIQEVNNYNTDTRGDLVLKPEITDVCSVACLRHGSCVNGKCVCEAGYRGDNCQLLADQAPQLLRIRGSNICDINQRPCRQIFIDALHFQNGDQFKCKVQEVLPNGQVSSEAEEQAAQFISGNRLACLLPDAQVKTDRSVRKFAVSVTFDGRLYSNVLSVTIYDSSCQQCDNEGCSQKANTCLIKNLCYQNGDIKAGNKANICDVSSSTSQWSTATEITKEFPNIGESVLIAVNDDHNLVCTFQSNSHGNKTRFEITWLLDGIEVKRQVLSADEREAYLITNVFRNSGAIICQVRSFFDGHAVFSPFMKSNSLQVESSASERRRITPSS